MTWPSGPGPWGTGRRHLGGIPETDAANLLADHEALIRALRVDLETCADRYHDIGTNDFLTGLMEKHEKMAWMLRAYVEGKSV